MAVPSEILPVSSLHECILVFSTWFVVTLDFSDALPLFGVATNCDRTRQAGFWVSAVEGCGLIGKDVRLAYPMPCFVILKSLYICWVNLEVPLERPLHGQLSISFLVGALSIEVFRPWDSLHKTNNVEIAVVRFIDMRCQFSKYRYAVLSAKLFSH